METLKYILLGIVQGLTEFLPVSSSGHLTIFQQVAGMELSNPILLDTILHIGTLVSVVLVFWKDIRELFVEFFGLCRDCIKGKPNLKNPYRRMLVMLIIATLPLIIILPFKDYLEIMFENIILVGIALIVTGTVLFISDRIRVGKYASANAPLGSAVFVGLAQMIAVLPGISRSGSTIVASEAVGYSRKFAIKFSFLMSVIAILGATVVQIPDAVQDISSASGGMLAGYALGMIAAVISGIAAIKFMVNLINRGKFHIFGYYCWAAGIFSILWGVFF